MKVNDNAPSGISSGTKLAIGLVLGGTILGLIALKYREFEARPITQPTTQTATQPTTGPVAR